MQKGVLFTGLIALAALGAKAQSVIDTVSIGAGYANHTFYNLESGAQSTAPRDNWDLAFEISGYSAAVLANTQKANFAVYRTPYSIANYANLDTAGISTWVQLHNSDETWALGAFNRGAIATNANDLGWGVYDQNTHYIIGDSCFVVKLSPTSYKKLKIISLISGVYMFEYANLDGSAVRTASLSKSAYSGKNFAYYDMTTDAVIDREPLSVNWDLMFGRYVAFVSQGTMAPVPYAVAGVLANKGNAVLQLNDVQDPESHVSWAGNVFSTNISTIGHDWKAVNMNTLAWNVTSDTIYFMNDRFGAVWKLRFTGFGGSSNGNYIFSKEKVSLTGVHNASGHEVGRFSVYPNPSQPGHINLLFSGEAPVRGEVSVVDMNGRVISTDLLNMAAGLGSMQVTTDRLSPGVYLIRVATDGQNSVQKIIIH